MSAVTQQMQMQKQGARWPVLLAGAAVTAWLGLHGPAVAMQSLDDGALSSVSAQSGIELNLDSPVPLGVNKVNWVTDAGAAAFNACTGGVANQHACTAFSNVQVYGSPGALKANLQLDVGTTAAAGGNIAAGVQFAWDPTWVTVGGTTIVTPTVNYSANSMGALGLYSTGHLKITNRDGIFNGSGVYGTLDFQTAGDVIVRQGIAGTPELSLGNFSFLTRSTNGYAGGHLPSYARIAIDANGVYVNAPYTYTELLFDVMYKFSPVNFDRTGRESVTLFGWTGGLKNPTFRVGPGGYAYGTYASTGQNILNATNWTFSNGGAKSEGLTVSAGWDFDTDAKWIIGQAGGNRTQVHFSDFQPMGGSLFAQPSLYVPVILDVIQNGTGPMGLCLGGGFTSGVPVQASCTGAGGTWVPSGVPVGKAALAALLRDVHLWAYNTKVQVIDPTSANPLSTFNWGLVYTYGKLDADIFFYPEGRGTGITPTATASGIKADITLAAQSPGFWERANSSSAATRALAGSNWRNNTHFMLADTNVGGGGTQFGVGLVNADLLWVARNVYFRTIAGDSGYPDMPGGLWIQTDSGSRYYMRGYFGGGMMSDLSQPVSMALVELDLSTNRFIFVMHPVAPVNNNAPIGFAALFDLDGQAKLSLAEKSSPTSSFQFYNVGGRLAWREGLIALTSGQNTPSGKPDLKISNELLIGASANFGSGGGAPLIGNAGFGSENYGRIIMPGGVWYNEFALKIP